jgi:Fe-S cluster assembly ATP-binding protein
VLLGMDSAWLERSVNVGFSGGEKKRAEVLQLAVLQPKVAILDEIDSGLDIDALKAVCEGIAQVRAANPDMGIVLITHYQRILNYLKPDVVHVMQDGKITRSGDFTLVQELEKHGYATFQ